MRNIVYKPVLRQSVCDLTVEFEVVCLCPCMHSLISTSKCSPIITVCRIISSLVRVTVTGTLLIFTSFNCAPRCTFNLPPIHLTIKSLSCIRVPWLSVISVIVSMTVYSKNHQPVVTGALIVLLATALPFPPISLTNKVSSCIRVLWLSQSSVVVSTVIY